MFAILIAAASTIPASAPPAPAASPATQSIQCQITVEVGPGYQVRCPALPISIDHPARSEKSSGARSDPPRGR